LTLAVLLWMTMVMLAHMMATWCTLQQAQELMSYMHMSFFKNKQWYYKDMNNFKKFSTIYNIPILGSVIQDSIFFNTNKKPLTAVQHLKPLGSV
jgi:hypothetical protein